MSVRWQRSYISSRIGGNEERRQEDRRLKKGNLLQDQNIEYSDLAADYLFQPIAVETRGPINESASNFFSLLAKKISHHSGDELEIAFCFSAFPCLFQQSYPYIVL